MNTGGERKARLARLAFCRAGRDNGSMPSTRELRQAELRALRQSDPIALLSIYQQIANLDQLAQRPGGVSFKEMIAAILDREEDRGAVASG